MNNQPAFPLHNHGAQTLGLHVTGMTLRDYFAAKAMQGLLASDVYAPIEKFATQAYAMADKMMEARNGSQ